MTTIIAAMGLNRVIGNKGDMPWRGKLPSELKRFMNTTKEHVVIMGRKTFESIGHPLSGRVNIVLSRQKNLKITGVTVIGGLKESIDFANLRFPDKDVFLIGGVNVFKEGLSLADKIYLSVINKNFEGDTCFPGLGNEWKEVSREKHEVADKDMFEWEVLVLAKKRFVYLKNARNPEYRQILAEIERAGVCPFCPENLEKWHKAPILKRVGKWIATPASMQKYEDTKFRFLIIGSAHKENYSELDPSDFYDIAQLVKWLSTEYDIEGYGLTVRSGNVETTGASVCHIHFHLISPEKDKTVYFPIG